MTLLKKALDGRLRFILSEESYSYSFIPRRCKSLGFPVLKFKIDSIVNKKGKYP